MESIQTSCKTVKLVEIISSFHGELPFIGRPCTIVRFAGCNLKCSYCDTNVSPVLGEIPVKDVIDTIKRLGNKDVLITGGEPLLQKTEVLEIVTNLNCFITVLETNGTLAYKMLLDMFDVIVADFKLNISSDEKQESLKHFTEASKFCIDVKKLYLKFVCSTYAEFVEAYHRILDFETEFHYGGQYIISPSWELVKSKTIHLTSFQKVLRSFANLRRKITKYRGNIYLQVQLHKVLGFS